MKARHEHGSLRRIRGGQHGLFACNFDELRGAARRSVEPVLRHCRDEREEMGGHERSRTYHKHRAGQTKGCPVEGCDVDSESIQLVGV